MDANVVVFVHELTVNPVANVRAATISNVTSFVPSVRHKPTVGPLALDITIAVKFAIKVNAPTGTALKRTVLLLVTPGVAVEDMTSGPFVLAVTTAPF